MAKQVDTRKKLQLLGKPLIGQLITDVIMMADQELLEEVDISSAEDYGRVSSKIIERLCQKYEEELVITCDKVVQRDMCDLIDEIKGEGKYGKE